MDYRRPRKIDPNKEAVVNSVPCTVGKSYDQFPNNCCKGNGCCPDGVARRIQEQSVNWASDTPMLLLAPRPARVSFTRVDASGGIDWLVIR